MADNKGPKSGWTDRELLVSLLYLVHKNSVTFDWNDGCYPSGRSASGFRQKINALKHILKPEWEAMGSGAPAPEGTPKKTPATPRKRKAKTDDEGNASESTPKKGRGRPKKKAAASEPEKGEENLGVKDEPKEDIDDIDEGA